MRYRGREFEKAELEQIRHLINEEGVRGRCHISRRVCEELRWFGPGGRLKEMACRVALLQMERDGLITLPAPLCKNHLAPRRPIPQTLFGEPGTEISCRVDQLGDIVLVPVKSSSPDGALWKELVDRYHYLGYKTAGGAQLRYLIRTQEGVLLGCLGFSAAAWKSAARDKWIGWNANAREKNLERVVDNSRFLILPWVRVKGLASKSLALAARTLPTHWERAYGYRPVILESFVEVDRFQGTCYRAANWVCVGQTQGRSKYDRHHEYSKPIKSIWLYPLSKNFKKVLSELPPATGAI
jgi:Domain of unknown function (DUF4338)